MKIARLTTVILLLAIFSFLFTAESWAGGKRKHRRIGFFHRICHAIRHVGDHIVNGIVDSAVKIHHALSGKKRWVWVCGHYDADGHHVKGHWRYVKPKKGGKGGSAQGPGQGGGNPPPAKNEGSLPPLPPATETPVAPSAPADSSAMPSEPPAPSSEPPAVPEPPKERTLGMLMTDLVSISGDMQAVQDNAIDTRNAKKGTAADGIEADFSLLADDRDADSGKLIKVVCDDLEKNNGQPGVFYTAFMWNLQHYSSSQREAIKDVIEAVKSDIRANVGHSKKNSAFKTRLDEMNKF